MVQEGDRIELVSTDDPYTTLDPGATGTVTGIETDPPELFDGEETEKIWVDWDNGNRLALIVGHDQFRILDAES